ncbi:hypothetical protein, partial [Pseudomonas sp. CFBP13528]|uniref:hypothetical protein n=1 Tax=Pseudomonas sp. CFBP13528 TaxID=2184006 RepID=UPI0019D667FD
QVVIFRSFRRFLQQLQPLALAISRKREANSTELTKGVKRLIQKKWRFPSRSPPFYIDEQPRRSEAVVCGPTS